MSVGNPVAPFVDGSKQRPFTFTPGHTLFNVTVASNTHGTRHIPLNALLMADSEDHVRAILGRMVSHCMNCMQTYNGYRHANEQRIGERDRRIDIIADALDGTGDHTLHIEPAPTNQLFKVDFSDNGFAL